MEHRSWKTFISHPLGAAAFCIAGLIVLAGIYAPLLACSKPLVVYYDKKWYFPLFHYLFYKGFYTKPVDLFYNLLMFTCPLLLACLFLKKRMRWVTASCLIAAHLIFFTILCSSSSSDPASYPFKDKASQWEELTLNMTPFAKISYLLKERHLQLSDQRLQKYASSYARRVEQKWKNKAMRSQAFQKSQKGKIDADSMWNSLPETERLAMTAMPTLYRLRLQKEQEEMVRCLQALEGVGADQQNALRAKEKLNFIQQRRHWIENESQKIGLMIMPFIRHHHWEEDVGGGQDMNLVVPWWELTRINHRDLVSSLLYGVRVSLMVGVVAVSLALLIALPIGAISGYFGGKSDILACRLMEIWESMPTFFMLLLVVAITASKSVFLVIGLLALFSWTSMARLLRAEVLKQRNLPYVEAGRALGLKPFKILLREILPNAMPPILTLVPFAMLGAITAEAGLSFLGLGEEGSCSLGVLMDEGRSAFPGESYLLWPPALFLTCLLICIAIIGDTLRDVMDPKLR